MSNLKKRIVKILASLLVIATAYPLFNLSSLVAEAWNTPDLNDDPLIVVSLGDSYSSGEGVEPFYGQDADYSVKLNDPRWLAHQSENSWPGKISIKYNNKTVKLSDYHTNDFNSDKEVRWYFRASSGAKTENLDISQKKTVKAKNIEVEQYLTPQLDEIVRLNGSVDYVTITMGGNDVDFSDILSICIMNDAVIDFGMFRNNLPKKLAEKVPEYLPDKLDELWGNIDGTVRKLVDCYRNIESAVGKQAAIIVAGYPKLVRGNNGIITPYEAQLINSSVSDFNKVIERTVEECRTRLNMNIYFVDVETAFDGHEANLYNSNLNPLSEDWINPLILLPRSQDIDLTAFYSAYSFHPNDKGTTAYAECVSRKIQDIEDNKQKDEPKPHEHQFSASWSNDKTYHWHKCTGCDEVSGKEKHKFGDWTVTKQATETSTGSKERKCTVCGYKQEEMIPKTTPSHNHNFGGWQSQSNDYEDIIKIYRVCSTCSFVEEIDCPFYIGWVEHKDYDEFALYGIKDSVKNTPFYSKNKVTIPDITYHVTWHHYNGETSEEDIYLNLIYLHKYFGGEDGGEEGEEGTSGLIDIPSFIKTIELTKTINELSLDTSYLSARSISLSVASGNKKYKLMEGSLVSVGSDNVCLEYSITGEIPSGVTIINWFVFSDFRFSNTNISIPTGVKSINWNAYNGSNITSVSLPSSIENLYYGAFADCPDLMQVNYSGTVAQWNAVNCNNAFEDGTIITCSDGSVTISN